MASTIQSLWRSSAPSQLASRYLRLNCRPFSSAAKLEDGDFFSIFELPRTFSLSKSELKNSYRQLMIHFHPDKYANQSSEEREKAESHAAAVTAAYDALKHPHTRATHLLEVLGKPLDESASSVLVGNEFLMDILEIREEVDSISGDEFLKPLLEAYRARKDETIQYLEGAFASGDLDRALELTAQLQYWNRIEETLLAKIENNYD